MATGKVKLIAPKEEQVKHTHQDNWEVMKPFVKFSFGALKVITVGLVAIVKALPLLKSNTNSNTSVKRR